MPIEMKFRIESAKGVTAGAAGVHLNRTVFYGTRAVATMSDLGKAATDGCVTLTYDGGRRVFADDRAALRFLHDFGVSGS